MDIRELKYFIQVAKDGNYSVAARKLYISQPALSKVIHKLEEMGFEFFYTFQKRQNLTDLGMAFYEKAVRVVSEYEGLMETALRARPSTRDRCSSASPRWPGRAISAI